MCLCESIRIIGKTHFGKEINLNATANYGAYNSTSSLQAMKIVIFAVALVRFLCLAAGLLRFVNRPRGGGHRRRRSVDADGDDR